MIKWLFKWTHFLTWFWRHKITTILLVAVLGVLFYFRAAIPGLNQIPWLQSIASQQSTVSQSAAGGDDEQPKFMTVQSSSESRTLHFSGYVQPRHVNNVTSPVDGRIDEMGFDFGQEIKKGQLLIRLSSEALEKDYRAAVTDYLQKRAALNQSTQKLQGDKLMYDEGLLSQEQFTGTQNDYNNANMAMLESTNTLATVAQQAGIDTEQVKALQTGDIEAIQKVLAVRFNNLDLHAPTEGVALFPDRNTQTTSGGDSGNQPVIVGAEVKRGQLLVAIGDLNGLSVNFNANEIDVKQIKPGQPITVTGTAFSDVTLEGKVTSVASQASADASSSGLPAFPIKAVVPALTPEQRKRIDVGMTTTITMVLKSDDEIAIPIYAVYTKNGSDHFVRIKDSASSDIKEVQVETGPTTQDKVVIRKGLKPGDQIVLSD